MEQPYEGRWSPLAWDSTHTLDSSETDLLLDAARWSPSAGNSQPWSFVTALRGEPVHTTLLTTLAPSSRRWAPAASLLVVNICHRFVDGTDWDYSEFAEYDLGQSVAHMTMQAHAMGLQLETVPCLRPLGGGVRAGRPRALGRHDHDRDRSSRPPRAGAAARASSAE